MSGWINFAFCITVNYYQLTTLVEVNEKVLNVSGLVIHSIFFLFLVVTLGQPNLLCLKQLFMNLKLIRAKATTSKQQVEISDKKQIRKVAVRHPNPERLKRMQVQKQLFQMIFIRGMLSRGLTPVANLGDGNCVFISLAQIVLGDSAKFEFMRYIVAHRLNKFP